MKTILSIIIIGSLVCCNDTGNVKLRPIQMLNVKHLLKEAYLEGVLNCQDKMLHNNSNELFFIIMDKEIETLEKQMDSVIYDIPNTKIP